MKRYSIECSVGIIEHRTYFVTAEDADEAYDKAISGNWESFSTGRDSYEDEAYQNPIEIQE